MGEIFFDYDKTISAIDDIIELQNRICEIKLLLNDIDIPEDFEGADLIYSIINALIDLIEENNSIFNAVLSCISELQKEDIIEINMLTFVKDVNEKFTSCDNLDHYFMETYRDLLRDYKKDLLYNSNEFGGDQGKASFYFKLGDSGYKDIIHNYYPDMTDEEIADYLCALNEVGCGYTASANYIFEAYIDKPDEFEEKFGFPMFRVDEFSGETVASVDYLVTDMYCYLNKNNKIFKNPVEGVINIKDSIVGENTEGSSYSGSSYKNYGITSSKQDSILTSGRYECSNVSTDEIKGMYKFDSNFNNYKEEINEKLEQGDVIQFSVHKCKLYYVNPNTNRKDDIPTIIDGGHDMTITGVNENGEYIVSSWGEKYILDTESLDPMFRLNAISFDKGDDTNE